MTRRTIAVLALSLALEVGGSQATADEVIFVNGDRLSGTITGAADGRLTIKTEMAGEVTVELAKVRTFSTREPVVLRVGDATLRATVTPGPEGSIEAIPEPGGAAQRIALAGLTAINPPPVRWTGAISATGLFTTGNSETANIGLKAEAVRRSEVDRITAGAGYLYGRQRRPDTGDRETTIDNAFGFAKYDYFFTRRLYGLASIRVERDRIAELDLRLTPSLGVGYQWFESAWLNLATEAGLAWVYEDVRSRGHDERVSGRLAYRLDARPHDAILLFHTLEWLPAVEDPLAHYHVNADAGFRTTIMGDVFSEAKVELRYDSTPARGAEPMDVRYQLSLGWSF